MSTTTDDATPNPTPRRFPWLALKLVAVVAAFTFILSRQPISEFVDAIGRISPWAVALTVVLQSCAVVLGTTRWRLLMSAYGAAYVPAWLPMLRVYFVGQFYNTFLPGAVGGDVLRGVVTRKAFGAGGATAGVAVVFVERVLGLSGVLAVTALAVLFDERQRLGPARVLIPSCLLGLAGAAGAVLAVALGRRLAPYVPGRLGGVIAALPRLQLVTPLLVGFALSIGTHSLVALCGHTLLRSMEPRIPLFDSFLAMPLAGAASFIPLSVAGAGPRDLILVELYAALGVPRAAGAATAVGFLLTNLGTASIGGLLQLIAPIQVDAPPDSPPR